jgi:hypothetical protein
MSSSSRRNFLVLSGTAVLAPSVLRPSGAQTSTSGGARAEGPMVAYVEDASSGEVLLMLGERQMVVHDAGLVARLSGHLG